MSRDAYGADGDPLEELPDYRPLSFLAIVAIAFALPGVLAIFHIGFLVFPVLAIGIALVAWRQSSSASFPHASRRPAQIALFVCLFLIGFAIVVQRLNARREYNFAYTCVQSWLDSLRGENPYEAYLLTLAPSFRPLAPEDEVTNVRISGRQAIRVETEEDFKRKPVNIALADPTNRVEFAGYSRQESPDGRILYRFVCLLSNPEQSPAQKTVVIDVQSTYAKGNTVDWQIGNRQLFE